MSKQNSHAILKKIIIPLAAAVISAAAVGGYCFFSEKSAVSGSAIVYFTADDNNTIGTERSVSLLKNYISSEEFLGELAQASACGTDSLRMADIIRAEAMRNPEAVMISVRGLEDPSYAPIILSNALNLCERNEKIPPFTTLSFCDMNRAPKPPFYILCGSSAAVIWLLTYVITAIAVREKAPKKQKKPKAPKEIPASVPGGDDSDITETEETDLSAITFVSEFENLGSVLYSDTKDIAAAGYVHAAERLIISCMDMEERIIAFSAAHSAINISGSTAFDVKAAIGVAKALSVYNLRTMIIECGVKTPQLAAAFGKQSAGGISDIITGGCTVWDAVITDAAPGIDIIAERTRYPSPIEIFSADVFPQIVKYISSQYDMLIITCPEAFNCEEWGQIYRVCTGIVAVSENGRSADICCTDGLKGSEGRMTAVMNVSKQ